MKRLILFICLMYMSVATAATINLTSTAETGFKYTDMVQLQTMLNGYADDILDDIGGGSGEVSISGTPVDDDIAVWTAADTLEGLSAAEFYELFNLETGVDFYSKSGSDTAHEAELVNSAGLLAALNDETGSGLAVFDTSPTLVTPLASVYKISDNAVAPSSVGEFTYDNTVTGLEDGGLAWYDDDEVRYLIDLDSSEVLASGDDGHAVVYNWNAGDGYFDLQEVLNTTGTVNADEITVFSDSNTLKALTEAEFKIAYNMVADVDYEGALVTSSDLSDSISDETGTGDAVFNTNPIFIGGIILPSSDSNPTATAGYFRHDSVETGMANGVLKFFDGNESKRLAAVDNDEGAFESGDDSHVLTYNWNGGDGYFDLQANGAGAATVWSSIGAAGADDTIALTGYEVGWSSTIDEAGGVALTVDHTDSDGLTNDTHLLELQHSNDGDAQGEFLLLTDNDGDVKLEIVEEGKILMTPGDTGDVDGVINITPSAAIGTTAVDWDGIKIDGSALDPSEVDVEICGVEIDFSGIAETNSPEIKGVYIDMPVGTDTYALQIDQGRIHYNYEVPSDVGASFTVQDTVIDVDNLNASSAVAAMHVSVAEGTPAGDVAAVLVRANVQPVVQLISSPATPSQTEFAGEKTGGGVTWADGVDASEIFVANGDELWFGAAAQFSEIAFDLSALATKSCGLTFYYSTGAATNTQFYPTDTTDGMQQNGSVLWDISTITGSWTGDGDPGEADTTAGYWIRIVRTASADPGSPTVTTAKIGADTIYKWDEDGFLNVKKFTSETIFLAEQADASADVAGYGQIWVNEATPNELWFTDDAGTDVQLGVAGGADVTSVGDCASGACGDGTSDGGTYLRLYDGDSNYTELDASDTAGDITLTLPGATGTLLSDVSAINGELITNDTIDDDSIDFTDVTSTDLTFDADTVALTSVFSGTTSLEETTAADDSGAYLIGTFDEFANSSSSNVQDVLDDLDAAISASASAYSDINDPSTNTTIAFGGYTNLWTSILDTGTVFKIDNTDSDLAGDTVLLELEFTDDGDANGIFLQCNDNNGDAVFTVGADGEISTGSSGTGVITIGDAGVTLTDDGDGGVTLAGIGDGSDEDLKFNLDDTANEVTITSSTGVTDVNFGSIQVNQLSVETDYIPVGYMTADGTTDPGDLTAKNNLSYRDFDDSSEEDLEFIWVAPNDLSGSTIKVRVLGLITNATPPGSGEGISWGIASCSSGDDDDHDCTVGTEVNSEDASIDSQVQWDYVVTPYVEVTPTALAAGEFVSIKISRDVADIDDDYAQDVGFVGVDIKYKRLNDDAF